MLRKLILTAAILLAAMPARAEGFVQMDIEFGGIKAAAVARQIATECMTSGFSVVEQSPTMVTCQRQLQGVQAAVTMFLMSNMYSTPPIQTVHFAIVQLNDSALRVQASAIMQSQMPYGQMRTIPMDDPGSIAALQQTLANLGGH